MKFSKLYILHNTSKSQDLTLCTYQLHLKGNFMIWNPQWILSVAKIFKDEMETVHATEGKKRNTYMVLVGKHEGLTRPKQVQHSINMDLKENGWSDINWTHLDHNRDKWQAMVNMLWQNTENFVMSLGAISFSSMFLLHAMCSIRTHPIHLR